MSAGPAGEVVVVRTEDAAYADLVAGLLESEGVAFSRRSQFAGGMTLTPLEVGLVQAQWHLILVPTVAASRAAELIESLPPPDLAPAEDSSPLAPGALHPASRGSRKRSCALLLLLLLVLPLAIAALLMLLSVLP